MVGKACRVRGDDEFLIAVMSHFQPNDGVAIYYGAFASVLDFILIYIFTTSKPSCQCAEAKKSLLRRPMKMSVRLRGESRVTPPTTMFKSPPSIRSKRPRIQKYVDQFSFSIYTWYIYIITDWWLWLIGLKYFFWGKLWILWYTPSVALFSCLMLAKLS